MPEDTPRLFRITLRARGAFLDKADREGKKILFEAQLGALRDIDFGIYPFTSSSNVIGSYAPIGAGIPGHKLHKSIGIMKAYSSCVGEGPFTAELAMTEEEKNALREAAMSSARLPVVPAAWAPSTWWQAATAYSARVRTSWP